MKIPSEEIGKVGLAAEIESLRAEDDSFKRIKISAVKRLIAEHEYMKEFIDEIYAHLDALSARDCRHCWKYDVRDKTEKKVEIMDHQDCEVCCKCGAEYQKEKQA